MRPVWLAACLVAMAMGLNACGGAGSSGGGSSSVSPTGPTASSGSGQLVGHITDAVTGKDLAGAVVTVAAGANAGKTATTDATGSFTLSGMDLTGSTTVTVTLAGYTSQSTSVSGLAAFVVNVRLIPVGAGTSVTDSVSDTIGPNTAPCSLEGWPCKTYAVQTQAQGDWDATLTWADATVVLSIEMWNNTGRLAQSTSTGAQSARLQVNRPPGPYELRVRFVSGTKQTAFTLSGTRPF